MEKSNNFVSNPLVRGYLEFIGVFVAIIGLAAVFYELNEAREQRLDETIVRHWTIITTKAPGSSGKVDALEYLARQEDPEPLEGIDLSCKNMGGIETRNGIEICPRPTYLRDLDLSPDVGNSTSGANLKKANLSNTDLTGADLTQAILEDANFRNAILTDVDFDRAILEFADLSGTIIKGTIFEGANLSSTNFQQAELDESTTFEKSWVLINSLPKGKLRNCKTSVVPQHLCGKRYDYDNNGDFEKFISECKKNEPSYNNFIETCIKVDDHPPEIDP